MTIPLDPGAGGQSIGTDALNMADIIVSTTNAGTSRFIRAGTWSSVSHAALYIAGDQVVEAIGEGVVLRTLEDSLREDILAVVYRVPGLTQDQAQRARDFVGMNLGKPYSVPWAAAAGLSYDTRNSAIMRGVVCLKAHICSDQQIPTPARNDKFFCSQLVLEAFKNAGVPLIAGVPPSHVAPADIPDLWMHKSLLYVGHLIA